MTPLVPFSMTLGSDFNVKRCEIFVQVIPLGQDRPSPSLLPLPFTPSDLVVHSSFSVRNKQCWYTKPPHFLNELYPPA